MHKDSVFERFYRADNSESRTAEGTGIGLSLVKELVRLHGGNVGVLSEVGVGSTFWVWIPRGLDHLAHDKIFENVDPGLAEALAFKEAAAMAVGSSAPALSAVRESAMDRWNSKARGIERTSILEVSHFLPPSQDCANVRACSKSTFGSTSLRVGPRRSRWRTLLPLRRTRLRRRRPLLPCVWLRRTRTFLSSRRRVPPTRPT